MRKVTDAEYDVFPYLDDLHFKGQLDMLNAQRDVMHLFDLPPSRALELIARWSRTFGKRHPDAKAGPGAWIS